MQVTIDYEFAARVLNTLYAQYLAKRFPYNTPDGQVPQVPENMPQQGFVTRRDHACFLLLVCLYMRGKIKSHTAIRAFTRLYERHPEIFRPGAAQLLPEEWLQAELQNVGLGFSYEQNARFWIENMRRVNVFWGGDPRNIFEGATSYEQLAGRICNAATRRKRYAAPGQLGFQGFQLKMTSMLIYFFLDAKLVEPLKFPVPVDFHVMRILIANGAVTMEGAGNHKNEKIQDAIREFSLWYCATHNVDYLHVSEFIWCFSRAACDKHPGNTSTYIGPRSSRGVVIAKPVTWSLAQRRAYNLACRQCPIEATCEYCIPAAPYYNHGQLIIRNRRNSPPQRWLFRPTLEVLPERRKKNPAPRQPEAKVPDTQLKIQFP